MIDWLARLTLPQAIVGSLLMNSTMFLLTLGVGHWLVYRYRDQRVTAAPDPLESAEVLLAISCVLLNSVVAVAGWCCGDGARSCWSTG